MKVILESTDKVVTLVLEDGSAVPARIWEGHTGNGVRCHAFITRIAVHEDDDNTEFERDIQRHRKPSAEIEAYPARLTL